MCKASCDLKKYVPLALSLAALALAVAAYVKKPEASPHATEDHALRFFLGINAILANYHLPEDAKYFAVFTLTFADGKLLDKERRAFGETARLERKPFQAEYLWSRKDRTVALVTFGAYARTESDFWMKLDGGVTSGHVVSYEGYTILGWGFSSMEQEGGKRGVSPDFLETLRDKKYMGALAIKTFKTQEEYDAFQRAF
jgi:hypothetical protein